MSFTQTFQAFHTANLTAGQKLVLAGIATFADAKSGKCWPSIATIAARCSMGVRTVQRHIAALVNMGYLVRIYREGRAAVTRLVTPANLAPPPLPIWHPEPAIPESVNEITALPEAPAPVVAEVPAVAAVVVFESVDTQQPDSQQPDSQQPDTAPAEVAIDLPTDNPLADVPVDLLHDFGVVRKAKKKSATVTKTEAIVFASEATKAGLSVAEAVRECILRGWSRFEAGWIPAKTPVAPVQRVYVPEVAQPCTPEVKSAAMAALTALRNKITQQAKPKGYSVLT